MESNDSGRSAGGFWGCLMHILLGRWFSVYLSFLIMAGAGAHYLFGSYAQEIKALGFDRDDMDQMNFYKDVGATVGIFAGLIAEVTPTWFVLLIGAVTNFGGYFMVWQAVTLKIPKPELWQMCFYLCIGATSQNFTNTAAVVTCIKNFPESRGVMFGLLKGLVGLSGAILVQLNLGMNGDDAASLIFLISWLPAVLTLISVFTIRPMKLVRQHHEIRILYHYLYVCIGLAVFLMVATLTENHLQLREAYIGFSSGIVVFFLLLLFISLREELFLWKLKKAEAHSPVDVVVHNANPSLSSACSFAMTKAQNKSTPFFSNIFNKPPRGEDHSILQAIFSVDMLIILVASACGMGAGLTAINNIEKIGMSLKYTPEMIGSFQSLVSIWNFFGRVFSGFVSEYLLQKFKVPRPAMLTVALSLSSIGYLFVAFPIESFLRIACVIIGFTYGCQTPLFYIIISEIFGLKYFSTLFNFGQLGMILGTYLLNMELVGKLYKMNALKDSFGNHQLEIVCVGEECFKYSFVVMSVVAVAGAFVSYFLWSRTSDFYTGDIYKRFRNDEQEQQGIPKDGKEVSSVNDS